MWLIYSCSQLQLLVCVKHVLKQKTRLSNFNCCCFCSLMFSNAIGDLHGTNEQLLLGYFDHWAIWRKQFVLVLQVTEPCSFFHVCELLLDWRSYQVITMGCTSAKFCLCHIPELTVQVAAVNGKMWRQVKLSSCPAAFQKLMGCIFLALGRWEPMSAVKSMHLSFVGHSETHSYTLPQQ